MDTDRDLPATTAGTPTHDMAHSLTGNLWWLLPPAPALCYPLTVKALFESGKLLHRVSGPGDAGKRRKLGDIIAIAETEGSVQIFIADNPTAVSRAAVQTLVRVARFSAKWITSGLPVIQEERLTNLNEPSLNSYLTC
jgi:hypothetical protein